MSFTEIASQPVDPSGAAILAHLTEAAAFRYARALEGLSDHTALHVPPGGGMGLLALLRHMRELATRLRSAASGEPAAAAEGGLDALREGTLTDLAAAGAAFRTKSPDELAALTILSSRGAPGDLWNIVHGPLADILTHIGQVNTLRRLAGNPAAPTDHFHGRPVEAAALRAEEPLLVHDADLAETTFRDVALTGARFDDVSLAGAKFTNVTFAGATLRDVDLSNVDISDANLEGLRIDGELWNAT